jgi:RNA polymerase-binding transcription factor DksA
MIAHKPPPGRARLLGERESILTELTHLREVIQAELDLEPDEGDQQITEHETAAILVAILEQKLHDIEHALASMKRGVYAHCERCKEPIEPARLAAKPDARYCIRCQERVERIVQLSQPRVEVEFELEFEF